MWKSSRSKGAKPTRSAPSTAAITVLSNARRPNRITFGACFEGTFPGFGTGEPEPAALPPYEFLQLYITVRTTGASSSEANVVNVSGGGAKPATLTEPIRVGASTPFGVADYKMVAEEEGGGVSTQAGVHPFQLTTTVVLNTSEAAAEVKSTATGRDGEGPDVQAACGVDRQPDAVSAMHRRAVHHGNTGANHNDCAANTALGVATVTVNVPGQA